MEAWLPVDLEGPARQEIDDQLSTIRHVYAVDRGALPVTLRRTTRITTEHLAGALMEGLGASGGAGAVTVNPEWSFEETIDMTTATDPATLRPATAGLAQTTRIGVSTRSIESRFTFDWSSSTVPECGISPADAPRRVP